MQGVKANAAALRIENGRGLSYTEEATAGFRLLLFTFRIKTFAVGVRNNNRSGTQEMGAAQPNFLEYYEKANNNDFYGRFYAGRL